MQPPFDDQPPSRGGRGYGGRHGGGSHGSNGPVRRRGEEPPDYSEDFPEEEKHRLPPAPPRLAGPPIRTSDVPSIAVDDFDAPPVAPSSGGGGGGGERSRPKEGGGGGGDRSKRRRRGGRRRRTGGGGRSASGGDSRGNR